IDEEEEDEWEDDDDWLMAQSHLLDLLHFSSVPMKLEMVRVMLKWLLADSIAIGELQPRKTTLEEGVQTLAEQGKLVAGKLDKTETQVLNMRDIVNNYPRGQVDLLKEEVDGLN
ncbi:hypothetical protein Tco_0274954, partial [Tanacetum coccineum]